MNIPSVLTRLGATISASKMVYRFKLSGKIVLYKVFRVQYLKSIS